MWYKLNELKTEVLEVAPKNKVLADGTTILNYNLYPSVLLADGYIEYNGNKPVSELKVVNGKIEEKTEAELMADAEKHESDVWNAYYVQNPDLTVCVGQYKQLLDLYNLPYTAKTYDISAAILADTTKTDIEKVNIGFTIQTLWNNIVLNMEYLGITNAMIFSWENMTKLIKYLPKETV